MDYSDKSRPTVLFFDVNETLLNLEPLRKSIDSILLEKNSSTLWFTTVLQYSLVLTVSGKYEQFMDIGAAVLLMLAGNRKLILNTEDAKEALQPMLLLKPHHDVLEGLTRFKKAGFRLAALTNSSLEACKIQMHNAGLSDLFECQLSVDTVAKFKPHKEVYQWACKEMNKPEENCMLVAAHAWDVAGAAWAGMQTAFIERAGNQTFSLALSPEIIATDLNDLYNQIIQT
ncbi:MAG: haloacid dehalogenase type II [Methylophilaceae bacterium]|nr:haloacid dehalogenase type II [Methylophilaceae bacterium]